MIVESMGQFSSENFDDLIFRVSYCHGNDPQQ